MEPCPPWADFATTRPSDPDLGLPAGVASASPDGNCPHN